MPSPHAIGPPVWPADAPRPRGGGRTRKRPSLRRRQGPPRNPGQPFLRSLGATPVAYGEGLVGRAREIAPNGVDLALDTAGHGALPDLIELTGSPDNVVTNADFGAQNYGVRATLGREGRSYHALGQTAQLFEDGKFTMPVAETFPLEQAAQAHRVSQDGHVRGKLVLIAD